MTINVRNDGYSAQLGDGTIKEAIPVFDAKYLLNMESTLNSTTTLLGISGVYTGTAEDVTAYADIRVTVFSDVASATDGFQMQISTDGVNWDGVDAYTIPANTNKSFGVPSASRWFRIVYTNGGTAQTSFRLFTKYLVTMSKPSSVRMQDGRSIQNDFEEVAAYNSIYNGASLDFQRSIINGNNTIGTGITAAGLLGQLDDVSPTAITENQFGNVRIGADRTVLVNTLSPYPYSAILSTVAVPKVAGSGNVANASAVATLTPTATTTQYISGFEVTGSGATAALPVTVTVAGLLGGTQSYTYNFVAGVTSGNLPLTVEFSPPLPASAVNTAIVVTCPASGAGGTNNTVVAHGYYL